MSKHNELITHAFNKAGSSYNQHAHVQAIAGKKLIDHITSIKKVFSHVMDAGCGTGITTRALSDAIIYDSFIAIDSAKKLLDQVNVSPDKMLCLTANFNDISLTAEPYDLIFSNMALHWSDSLTHTLNIFHDALANDGILAFTIPLQGTFSEITEHYSTRSFPTLAETISLLEKSGYRLLDVEQQLFSEQFSDSLAALRSIKLTGATHVEQRRHKSLHGKSLLTQHPITQLSYQIGFFIAGKQHG